MPFKLKAYLPSKQKNVFIKELTYKQYRELVKSLYSIDKEESIKQYNSIISDLCEDIKEEDITFEDKLSLLLTVRNYCVSPDLKLKITTKDKNSFTYNITIDDLLNRIKSINKSSMVEWEGLKISMSSCKVRDEEVFIGNNKDTIKIIASHIDCIKIDHTLTSFKELTMSEREQIISSFPYNLYKAVLQAIQEQQKKYEELDLLRILNPINREEVLRLSQNITFETLQQLVGFCFTEELTNVYRAFYNIVHYANFAPDYIDNITPIEMQVYWMYYMEDIKKKDAESGGSSKLQLPTGLEDKLGF